MTHKSDDTLRDDGRREIALTTGLEVKKNNFFATLNNKIYDSYDSADLGLICISRELLRRNEILTIFVDF